MKKLLTLKNFGKLIHGKSSQTKTERMLQKAAESGLDIVHFECTPMTEEDRKGIPVVES